ncbi:MAG: PcfB family protein [Dorea sp.]|nr:PcfB family protein [Dorea sp.]
MQDEVNDKTLNLCIQAGRITAGVLKAAMRKYLNDQERQKNMKLQKKNAAKTEAAKTKARDKAQKKIDAKKPRGKMSMKQLMDQKVELKNIPITDQNIKSFDRIARKYGIDYSLKKDVNANPPRYMVFFKAKDVDVMTAAFKEYAGVSMKKKVKKPSVKKKLVKTMQRKAKQRQRVKQKQKSRGQER